jgi:hypothetical protein
MHTSVVNEQGLDERDQRVRTLASARKVLRQVLWMRNARATLGCEALDLMLEMIMLIIIPTSLDLAGKLRHIHCGMSDVHRVVGAHELTIFFILIFLKRTQ